MVARQEQFNYYVGIIFAELLETFPIRHTFDMLKLAGAEACDETYEAGRWTGIYLRDGNKLDLKDELDFIFHTALWLHETGYLIGYVGQMTAGRKIHVTLSVKALELLKAVPSSVNVDGLPRTFGDEILSAVKSATKKKVADAASQALSYAMQAGWDYLSKSVS